MRILLLGEFSGFYKNLKVGLENLGHEVDIYANGDGIKQIDGATACVYKKKEGHFLYNVWGILIYPFSIIGKIKSYDVVQFLCPHSFNEIINYALMRIIIKIGKKTYYTACGESFALYKSYERNEFEYYMFDGLDDKFYYESIIWNERLEKKLLRKIDGIIPICYEYANPLREYNNLKKSIMLPVDTKSINYKENIVNDKVVVFHGVTRETDKGTQYIREAMNRVQEEFPNDVECIIDGRLPQAEFLELMERTNIVIDQCKSYWYGMTALYAMAQGKVVLSGRRKESLEHAGIVDCPIIEAVPNANQIYNELKKLILDKKRITEIGHNSREYVVKYHDCDIIAEQYLNTWQN